MIQPDLANAMLMKFIENDRKYAAEQGLSAESALKRWIEEVC